jgi:hypothetical protein
VNGGSPSDEGIVGTMPHTEELAANLPPQQTALALHRALDHIHELDAADLPMPDGGTEPIVTVAEVRAWLEGLRVRARAGERL